MAHKDPIARTEYNRRYRAEHRDALRAYHRAWFKARWAAEPEFRAANRSVVSPEATRAHNLVNKAVKRGRLVRPSQCECCGAECKPEAAHSDYAKPFDVRWLCRPCHRTEDSLNPKDRTAKREPKRQPSVWPEYTCAWCGTTFRRVASAIGSADPACSISCGKRLAFARKKAA